MFHASARASYYAAFHSARVPIFERTGKATKTHSGVNTLFSQLALNEPEFDVKLRVFLSASYAYKTIADYEWTPEIRVTRARAIELLDVSHQFVATKTAILAA